MQSILAGQGNRSPGGKSARQERALGKIVKPAVKLENAAPRASPFSPSPPPFFFSSLGGSPEEAATVLCARGYGNARFAVRVSRLRERPS